MVRRTYAKTITVLEFWFHSFIQNSIIFWSRALELVRVYKNHYKMLTMEIYALERLLSPYGFGTHLLRKYKIIRSGNQNA
jgi:hypothetical protein